MCLHFTAHHWQIPDIVSAQSSFTIFFRRDFGLLADTAVTETDDSWLKFHRF